MVFGLSLPSDTRPRNRIRSLVEGRARPHRGSAKNSTIATTCFPRSQNAVLTLSKSKAMLDKAVLESMQKRAKRGRGSNQYPIGLFTIYGEQQRP